MPFRRPTLDDGYDARPLDGVTHWTADTCQPPSIFNGGWESWLSYDSQLQTYYGNKWEADHSLKYVLQPRVFLHRYTPRWTNDAILYAAMLLTTAAVIISVSGRVKEDYRWLILNQNVFNLLAVLFNEYVANCEANSGFFAIGSILEQGCVMPDCSVLAIAGRYSAILLTYVLNNVCFLTLFQLTLTRLLAVLFPLQYGSYVTAKMLIAFVLVFDGIFILACSYPAYIYFHFLFVAADDSEFKDTLNDVFFVDIPTILVLSSALFCCVIVARLLLHVALQARIGKAGFKSAWPLLKLALVLLLQTLVTLFFSIPVLLQCVARVFGPLVRHAWPYDRYCHFVRSYYDYVVERTRASDSNCFNYRYVAVADAFIVLFLIGKYRQAMVHSVRSSVSSVAKKFSGGTSSNAVTLLQSGSTTRRH